jgi:hypothetical protein
MGNEAAVAHFGLEGLKKTTNKCSKDSQFPDRNINWNRKSDIAPSIGTVLVSLFKRSARLNLLPVVMETVQHFQFFKLAGKTRNW